MEISRPIVYGGRIQRYLFFFLYYLFYKGGIKILTHPEIKPGIIQTNAFRRSTKLHTRNNKLLNMDIDQPMHWAEMGEQIHNDKVVVHIKDLPEGTRLEDLPSGTIVELDDDDIELSDTPIGEEIRTILNNWDELQDTCQRSTKVISDNNTIVLGSNEKIGANGIETYSIEVEVCDDPDIKIEDCDYVESALSPTPVFFDPTNTAKTGKNGKRRGTNQLTEQFCGVLTTLSSF